MLLRERLRGNKRESTDNQQGTESKWSLPEQLPLKRAFLLFFFFSAKTQSLDVARRLESAEESKGNGSVIEMRKDQL
jgi:hypothetical protein